MLIDYTSRGVGAGYIRPLCSLSAAAAFGAFELAEAAEVADKIGHDWKNPESYDADDGSVVDW
jgi:hypothetical protein